MTVLAKFLVIQRSEGPCGAGASAFHIGMQPVMPTPGVDGEDSIFGAATPSGSMDLAPLTKDAAGEFNIHDRFHLRFRPLADPITDDVMFRLPMIVQRAAPDRGVTYVDLRLGSHGECPDIFVDGVNATSIKMAIANAVAAARFAEGVRLVVDVIRTQ